MTLENTAILVIDMQNGFVHPEGSLPKAGIAMPHAAQVTAANADLLAEARGLGVPIVYTRHSFRPGFLEAPAGSREMLPEGCLLKGTWDAAVVDDLKPAEEDVQIEKVRYDAFLYTELEVVLRALGVTRVIVTGVVTSVCVESSVRSGHQRDFAMQIASDCVDGPVEFHQHSLDALSHWGFAEVAPWRELLATGEAEVPSP